MERRDKKNRVSIVVSAYNEEGNIAQLYREICMVIEGIEACAFEIVFVNDGSTDHTLYQISSLYVDDKRVKLVNLTRNFGHEIAMIAGMHYAKGDCVIFMDADLQHPPGHIKKMVELWINGVDVVLTKRTNMEDKGFVNRAFCKFFYRFLNALSDVEIPENSPDFRLIDRKYINILKQMDEREIMFRGMLNWMGVHNTRTIEFAAPKRFSGKTKYNYRSLFKLAFDSIIQFSIKPLRLATYLGLLAAFVSIVVGGVTVWEYFALDRPDTGFTTIIVTIVFLGSMQLIVSGIIGEYIGRIYLETKKRPLYVATYFSQDNQDKMVSQDVLISDNMLKSMRDTPSNREENEVINR